MLISNDIVLMLLGVMFGALIRIPVAFQPSSDQWGVYTKIDKHKGRKWITYDMHDSVIPGIFPYPMLLHFFISYFPRKFWRVISVSLNILPDLAASILVYLIVSFTLRDMVTDLSQKQMISFLSMSLYLTLPVLIPVTARMKAVNGRSLGALLSTVFFVSITLFLEKGGFHWIGLSVIFAFLTFLCSVFGLQVIFFFSIIFSLAYMSFVPFLVVFATLFIGSLFPPLGLKDILLFKANHYLWYIKDKNKVLTVANRNFIKNIVLLPYYTFTSPYKALRLIVLDSPLIIAFYSVIPLWFIFYIFFNFELSTEVWKDPLLKFCLSMVLSSLIVFVLTSTKWLNIFGQAERYFEYSAPMIIILFVTTGIKYSIVNTSLLTILIILQLCIVAFIHIFSNQYILYNLIGIKDNNSEEKKLADFLNRIPGDVNVATVPIKLPMLLSAFTSQFPDNKVKYYYRFILKKDHSFDGFKYFQEDTETTSIFKVKPQDLRIKYGINYIVTENDFAERLQSDFISVTRKLDLIYESGKYNVYKIISP